MTDVNTAVAIFASDGTFNKGKKEIHAAIGPTQTDVVSAACTALSVPIISYNEALKHFALNGVT